jgi:hypothetical protein
LQGEEYNSGSTAKVESHMKAEGTEGIRVLAEIIHGTITVKPAGGLG